MTTIKFLALSPVVGTRYSGSTLYAYGRLDEHGDTHGEALWVDEAGRVWADEGIVVGNTYHGRRTAPELVA